MEGSQEPIAIILSFYMSVGDPIAGPHACWRPFTHWANFPVSKLFKTLEVGGFVKNSLVITEKVIFFSREGVIPILYREKVSDLMFELAPCFF